MVMIYERNEDCTKNLLLEIPSLFFNDWGKPEHCHSWETGAGFISLVCGVTTEEIHTYYLTLIICLNLSFAGVHTAVRKILKILNDPHGYLCISLRISLPLPREWWKPQCSKDDTHQSTGWTPRWPYRTRFNSNCSIPLHAEKGMARKAWKRFEPYGWREYQA